MTRSAQFSHRGKHFLFDCVSLVPCEIDQLTHEVFELYPRDRAAIVAALSTRYPRADILGVCDELAALIERPSPEEPSASSAQKILTVWLQVAHDCNLRCTYCYAGQGSCHGPRLLMDWRHGKPICDWIARQCMVNFDGEPLMNLPIIRRIVGYFGEQDWRPQRSLQYAISSNATLLTEAIDAFIVENSIGVLFSIDGGHEVHDRNRPFAHGGGSYAQALRNCIDFLQFRDPAYVQIAMTYGRDDLNLRERTQSLRRRQGRARWRTSPRTGGWRSALWAPCRRAPRPARTAFPLPSDPACGRRNRPGSQIHGDGAAQDALGVLGAVG